jgi:hypothetical protein
MTTKFDCNVEVFDQEGVMHTLFVRVTYSYDEGTWRDSNGEGVSPSSELEYEIINWQNEDGKQGESEIPEGIEESDIYDAIENQIEEMGL